MSSTSPLAQLYRQYGLFLFLLCFAPLIPGVTELHAKAYLSLFSVINPDLASTKDAIKYLFGEKGLAVYRDYLKKHPDIILPNHVFNRFYRDHQPEAAIKLVYRLFFDETQRSFPQADLHRATVIQNYPHLFSIYSKPDDQPLRSRLMQMLASLMEIDQAIPPRLAAIDSIHTLITTSYNRGKIRFNKQLEAQFEAMAMRVKAELTSQATAMLPDLNVFPLSDTPPDLLTPEDISTCKDMLLHLASSTSPEVFETAQSVLTQLFPTPPFTPTSLDGVTLLRCNLPTSIKY